MTDVMFEKSLESLERAIKSTESAKTDGNGENPKEAANRRNSARQARFSAIRVFLERKGIDDIAVSGMPNDWFAQILLRMWENDGAVQPGTRKGLMLIGTSGNGKTTRMEAMAELFGFPVLRAAEMVQKVSLASYNGTVKDICNYPRFGNVSNPRCYDLVIDDLGIEPPIVNNFGTKHDYMEEVLAERYEAMRKGAVTHFSSNLTAEQIKERYGDRIYSRFKAMCIVVTMPNRDLRC